MRMKEKRRGMRRRKSFDFKRGRFSKKKFNASDPNKKQVANAV